MTLQTDKLVPDDVVAGFAEWVAKQPQDSKFDFFDCERCAFAQYLISSGHTDVLVGGLTVDFDGVGYVLPSALQRALHATTFGAVASRLIAKAAS